MRKEIWERRAAEIRDAASRGLSITETTRELGVNYRTLAKYARKYSIAFEDKRGRPTRSDEEWRVTLQALVDEGLTMKVAALRLGVSYATIHNHAHSLGVEFRSGWKSGADKERAEAMASMYRAGKTLAEIGSVYGVSRERVRQIISKEHGLSGKDGGQKARASASRKRREKERERKCQEKYGCTFRQLQHLRKTCREMREAGIGYHQTPLGAYQTQRSNARCRGIEWNLSIWDWWTFWRESGKWDQRGRTKDAYVMCRFGDEGAYEIGNIYIATVSHNCTVQPNNPYRAAHPRHAEVMEKLSKSGTIRRISHPTKYRDLPIGVTRHRCGRYQAQIGIAGKNIYLGTFGTPEEAHGAYLSALENSEGRTAA